MSFYTQIAPFCCVVIFVRNLHCFVARRFSLQIYAVLSVKFSDLKKCWCKKSDKYQVCRGCIGRARLIPDTCGPPVFLNFAGGAGVGLDEVTERAPSERVSRWTQSHRGGRLEDSPHSLFGAEEIPTEVPAFILVIYNFC